MAAYWTFTRQLWHSDHCGQYFCCCSQFAHTHRNSRTHLGKLSPPLCTFSTEFINNSSTLIWFVLYSALGGWGGGGRGGGGGG
jgi:hypothetical protein